MHAIKELYMINIISLEQPRDQDPPSSKATSPQFQVGDMVLIKNHYRDSPFDTKYIPSYRIVKLINEHAADVQDMIGKIRRVNLNDVHLMFPSEHVLSCLADNQTFGRVYINHPDIIPIWENKSATQNKSYPETPSNKILKHNYDLRSRRGRSYENPGLQSS